MDADWITSPNARRVLQHAADSRPAWLWSQDGQTLIWQNPAAGLFLAKLKKHGLKLAQPAVPIKGQVARNIRLGSPGRSSLARIQFLAGEKPASSTCATTPLIWQNGQSVLLIVGVDAIDPDILAAAEESGILSDGAETELPVQEPVTAETPEAEAVEPETETEASIESEAAEAEAPTESEPAMDDVAEAASNDTEAASQDGEAGGDDEAAWTAEDDHGTPAPEVPDETPLSEDEQQHADETAYARELDSWRSAEQDTPPTLSVVGDTDDVAGSEQDAGTPGGAAAVEADGDTVEVEPDAEPEADTNGTGSRLSRLVDRLAADAALYTPLTENDEPPYPSQTQGDDEAASEQTETDADTDDGAIAQTGELFTVTGRGFVADQADEPQEQTEDEADQDDLRALDAPGDDGPEAQSADDASTDSASDADEEEAAQQLSEALIEIAPPPSNDSAIVERVSRYNFDELSRILNDRVGDANQPVQRSTTAAQQSGALVSLGGETLVLNRLPLGILVFRDQQILFANRAITEMVGYDSVETLRQAGLAAVFPAAGPDEQDAGPVNHLVQRDGTLVPVTARLQSISWHGRPALMLSASGTEVRTGHEGAVNAFAQALADVRGDGFFEATRTGVVSAITPKASALLSQSGPVEGKALSNLIASDDVAALREFLDRPARFAETARPWLRVLTATGKGEMHLFAQGQAGVITGYFGFVHARVAAPPRLAGPTEADPALLGRISRGVRRPLNTIIGFADLLRSSGNKADPAELESYARDISAAGQDIAALVDELDDYARLRDGRYLPQRASIDLTEMLESCILRIRQQASNARVFVRNAISETLPRLTADRASLEQAVLNLLASAIDQSPNGGAVVISAQREDDGGIAVHVRDSSVNAVDMAERFVVFRDGPGRDGKTLAPVRSSVGLALTRSLLAVNAFSLSVDPAGEKGMLFTLRIPADLVETHPSSDVAE